MESSSFELGQPPGEVSPWKRPLAYVMRSHEEGIHSLVGGQSQARETPRLARPIVAPVVDVEVLLLIAAAYEWVYAVNDALRPCKLAGARATEHRWWRRTGSRR
mgnify:CR=1 FL=1|jgi:hypothetical protein